jgi:hypothetical protein
MEAMIEVAMVFDIEGVALYWHEPPGCSAASIPDSSSLWHAIWENRKVLGGVAHTHPWSGNVYPSDTDLTTFAAIEAGLGKRLVWPIVGKTTLNFFSWNSDANKYKADYASFWTYVGKRSWRKNMEELLEKSKGDCNG